MVARSGKHGGSFLVATFAIASVGCVSLKSASSGQIGCAEQDIVISDDKSDWGSRTWTAQCHGKKFFCTAVSTGKHTEQVNCKEAVSDDKGTAAEAAAPAAPNQAAAAATSGCQYDAQCKGDRICMKGECVAPASTSVPAAAAPAPSPSPTSPPPQ